MNKPNKLDQKLKKLECFSPIINNENLNKKLIGRSLEFDINEHRVATSTVIEKKNSNLMEKSNFFTFTPDFTSTPTYKIQKTSTPKSTVLMTKSVKKMFKKSTKCKNRCKCYCNSTFKEDVNVSMVFFGTKTDRKDKKTLLFSDRFYHKVKTVKKTTYITRLREEYYQNFNRYSNFDLKEFHRSKDKQTNIKFKTCDLYYSEENLQQVKLKFLKKYLKNKKTKRLAKYAELILKDQNDFFTI